MGQGMWEGVQSSHAFWNLHSPQNSTCPPTWKFSKHCLLFMEASLCRHGWPLMIELNLQTLELNLQALSPRFGGVDQNFQLSNHMVGSPGKQSPASGYLGAFQESPHQYNKRHLYSSYHLGNSKSFRSSVPGTGGRPMYR